MIKINDFFIALPVDGQIDSAGSLPQDELIPGEEIRVMVHMKPVGLAAAPVIGEFAVAHSRIAGPVCPRKKAVFVPFSIIIAFIRVAMENSLVYAAGKGPLDVPQLVPPGLLIIAGVDASVAASVHLCGGLNGINLLS